MKRRLTLQDYTAAMDAFVAKLDPGLTFQRLDAGSATIYIFLYDGAEIGRMSVLPVPAWDSRAGAYTKQTATADVRGRMRSHESHGDMLHVSEEEQARARMFDHLKRCWRAHMDLQLGQGMYADVWDWANGETEPPTEPEPDTAPNAAELTTDRDLLSLRKTAIGRLLQSCFPDKPKTWVIEQVKELTISTFSEHTFNKYAGKHREKVEAEMMRLQKDRDLMDRIGEILH